MFLLVKVRLVHLKGGGGVGNRSPLIEMKITFVVNLVGG